MGISRYPIYFSQIITQITHAHVNPAKNPWWLLGNYHKTPVRSSVSSAAGDDVVVFIFWSFYNAFIGSSRWRRRRTLTNDMGVVPAIIVKRGPLHQKFFLYTQDRIKLLIGIFSKWMLSHRPTLFEFIKCKSQVEIYKYKTVY